jgi:hypothetical protein
VSLKLLLALILLTACARAQTIEINGTRITVDGKRIVGINDCLFGYWGFDGGCRSYQGDCDGPDQIGERFTTLDDYSRAYRDAGFNTFRSGRGDCSPQSINQILPILAKLKTDGWVVWFSLFPANDPLLNTPAGLFYLEALHAELSPYVDIWEICGEARPSVQWTADAAARLRALDAAAGHPRFIATSFNDSAYGPYVDINSPHWYYGGPDIPSAFFNVIQQEYLKMPGKPIVFGEAGNQGQNWSKQNLNRLTDFLTTSYQQNAGIIFWNTSNARDYVNADAANIYLGAEERALTKRLLAAEREGANPPVIPPPPPRPIRCKWWQHC